MTLYQFDSPMVIDRRADDPPMLLEGATLVDGSDGVPAKNSAVLIDGDTITAVNGVPDGADQDPIERIDLSGYWIMPGLVDAHVHLDGFSTTDPYRKHLKDPRGTRMLRAGKYAAGLLAIGCTTIRDVGSPFGAAVRRAIESGVALGPRVLTSGPMVTATAGGGDPRVLPSILTRDHRLGLGIADGVEECAALVRRNLRDGADLISVMLCGGRVGDHHMASLDRGPEFSSSELNVICQEAHRRGLVVSAHAPGTDSLMRALESGVDTIEHPSADLEVLDQLRGAGTHLITTVSAFRRSGLEREASAALALATAALSDGVPIALGSSGSSASRGAFADEIEELLKSGIESRAVIFAATQGGAEALGISDQIGTITPGKRADILVLDFDPYRHPQRLGRPGSVSRIIRAA